MPQRITPESKGLLLPAASSTPRDSGGLSQGQIFQRDPELVEGPLLAQTNADGAHRCYVDLLVDGKTRIGPAAAIGKLREMTDADERLLTAVRKVETEAMKAHDSTAQCLSFAEEAVQKDGRSKEDRRRGEAAFLAANYSKKGKRQRQEELFLELEAAVQKGREELKRGILWPDQHTEAYADEVVRKCEPLIGPKVTKTQRSSLVTRVLKPFAAVFWLAGCKAPRVEGLQAHIQQRPDAQPMVKQPYKL